MLGAITGIERARVNELANPEEDRPLAPHWRVPRLKKTSSMVTVTTEST